MDEVLYLMVMISVFVGTCLMIVKFLFWNDCNYCGCCYFMCKLCAIVINSNINKIYPTSETKNAIVIVPNMTKAELVENKNENGGKQVCAIEIPLASEKPIPVCDTLPVCDIV